MTNKMNDKMSVGSRIAYTFGAFGNDFFYFALSSLLITFITTQVFNTGDKDMDNFYVLVTTNVIMILRIVELFIDPLIGNAVDRTNTRFGHFRPWVVIGGVVSSILLCVLFANIGGLSNSNPVLYIVIFAITYLTMDIFYSSKDIGFWSMLPALTLDNKQRESVATTACLGSTIGNASVNFIAMPVVLYFSVSGAENGDPNGWMVFGVIVAAVSILSCICVGLFTREKQNALRENKEPTKGFIKIVSTLFKNDQLIWIALPYVFYCVGYMTLTQLQLLYFQFVVGDASVFTQLEFINLFVGVASVLCYSIFVKLAPRRVIFTCCICCMLLGIAVYVISGTNVVLAIIGAEMFFFPQQTVFLVVLTIMTDCVEYGQLKLGHRDESLSLAVRPLVDKLGSALATGISGLCAVMSGISATSNVADVVDGIPVFKLFMFGLPAVLLIISLVIFLTKQKLTEKRHAQICQELEKSWNIK